MSQSFDRFSLHGRTAIITGAAGLLGSQHAKALLLSGATVVLTDVNDTALGSACKELTTQFDSDRIKSVVMDVSQPKNVESVARRLNDEGVHVDILINNAAVDAKVKNSGELSGGSRLENLSVDQWELEVRVGLTGALMCAKVFGTLMAERKRGVILNIASDLSVIAPDQRIYRREGIPSDQQHVKPVTYSIIKAGIIGLTRYLATYWADQGVRCNALSPGGVQTNQDPVFVSRLTSLIPLGRMASADEYQATVQFLCSDASAYLTGQNIVVDGGRSVW